MRRFSHGDDRLYPDVDGTSVRRNSMRMDEKDAEGVPGLIGVPGGITTEFASAAEQEAEAAAQERAGRRKEASDRRRFLPPPGGSKRLRP